MYRKVKSDAQVATNKNSDSVQKDFFMGGWGGQCPNSIFSNLPESSENSRGRKLIFGLKVNIDQANSQVSGYPVGGI